MAAPREYQRDAVRDLAFEKAAAAEAERDKLREALDEARSVLQDVTRTRRSDAWGVVVSAAREWLAANPSEGKGAVPMRDESELAAQEEREFMDAAHGDENLDNFDPAQEGGGDPCRSCGRKQDPWRYSRYCQACIWDGLADLNEQTDPTPPLTIDRENEQMGDYSDKLRDALDDIRTHPHLSATGIAEEALAEQNPNAIEIEVRKTDSGYDVRCHGADSIITLSARSTADALRALAQWAENQAGSKGRRTLET
jgi:hypothetical protein